MHVRVRDMVGEVWKEPSQLTIKKKGGSKGQLDKRFSCALSFVLLFLYFSVCPFSCFLFLFTAPWCGGVISLH